MKTIRLITFALVFVIFFSVWTPAPALARTPDAGNGKNLPALVSFSVLNRTYGPLQVSLQGKGNGGSYYFYVPQGKSTFSIAPGKYTYTVTFAPSSICKNWFSTKRLNTLVKTSNFNHLKNSIGPYKICSLR